MTVRKGEPQSHQNQGWELFTDHIIKLLNQRAQQNETIKSGEKTMKGQGPVIFMLWGKSAQEKGKIINQDVHYILTSSHPSPLACYKTQAPFMGSKCFSRANTILESLNLEPIDWKIS